MDGVIILQKFIPPMDTLNLAVFIILCVLGIGGIIALSLINNLKIKSDVSFSLIVAYIILLFFLILCLNCPSSTDGEFYYKVYCDETVNIKEFNKKYEVIGQEGIIYIVKERNLNNKGEE